MKEKFIAYSGKEISKEEILNLLRQDNENIFVEHKEIGPVIFAKQNMRAITSSGPFYNRAYDFMEVDAYETEEYEEVFGEEDFSNNSIYELARIASNRGLKVLKEKYELDTCLVVCDTYDMELFAGITNSNKNNVKLFYGKTKKNSELMFSNDKEILKNFCDDIHKVEDNTYIKKEKIYDLDGNKIGSIKNKKHKKEKSSNTPTFTPLERSSESANNLIDGINNLLVNVVNDSIKSQVTENLDDYLQSGEPKEKVEEFVEKELNEKTEKEVLKVIKETIEKNGVEKNIQEQLDNTFQETVDKYKNNISVPVVNIIKLKDTELGKTDAGFYHEKFEEILSEIQIEEPVMLVGPAGSGKNYSIEQASKALGLKMYYTNNASNEFKLTGFIDAGGTYRETEFYKAFKNGGIFFLDEIDNSDPSALIVINSALANGYMAFPHETIEAHKDFRMLAAANTWGKGADLDYVGRTPLDAATLDRFANIYFDYDRKLEANLYPNKEVLDFMWSFRDATEASKIHHVISTRGIGKVYKKEINHFPTEQILTSNVIKNLSQDDLNMILGNMKNIDEHNKFYEKAKVLELRR